MSEQKIKLHTKECEICVNNFDDNKHRTQMLWCGHTICHDCVIKIAVKYQVICPQCRRKTPLPRNKSLVPNYTLESVMAGNTLVIPPKRRCCKMTRIC